jgi:hypothetical protein
MQFDFYLGPGGDALQGSSGSVSGFTAQGGFVA